MTSGKKRQILVCVAWPYANGLQHIGHIAGAYLPPDIFARYQRMAGNDVLMVSGSDTHGTPVTVKADEEGTTAAAVVERFHGKFIESYLKMGFNFDLFTHTHTANHEAVTHEFFTDLLTKGFIYKDKSKQLYDPKAKKFLPDRYIEGTCPHCGFAEARGDQCDNCGKTYDATELKNPVSKMTGNRELEVRETEHFYLDLGQLNEPLLTWLNDGKKEHWRRHVLNFTRGELEKRELRGRAITRDMEWGVPIPLPGYDDKRIYVWFEAVLGYYSATKEWGLLAKDADVMRRYWDKKQSPDAESYYFIGKDNITFHTIMWPGILLAKGGLNLPYDVPANEYLNSYGRKFSKSRGTSIAVLNVLERYQPDALRYVLTALMPETSDVDFTWDDFLEKVNNELVANWGNLANRVLGFAYKRFDGAVPTPGKLDATDEALLAEVKEGFTTVGAHFDAVKLRAGMEEARRLSQKVNQYLSDKTPWTLIKTDAQGAANAIYVALQCIDWLKTLWAPILPFSSQLIHETLGYDGQLAGRQYTEVVEDAKGRHEVLRYDHSQAVGRWIAATLQPGQKMREPKAPFQKLDEKIVAQEADPS
jgi:methionyl-tRNA synthetase